MQWNEFPEVEWDHRRMSGAALHLHIIHTYVDVCMNKNSHSSLKENALYIYY